MRPGLRAFPGILVLVGAVSVSCSTAPTDRLSSGESRGARRGSIEVTARLVEVPQGAIFKRDLYNYTTVLRYEILHVHRGEVVEGQEIHVGHYNPFLPRDQATDRQVTGIGGNLQTFQADQVHRMALEVPIDDHYMGGIVNKYFDQHPEPIYWAVWTDLADD
jgi:hypothetical protein